jgi:putative Holliday junction resolvase
MPDTRVLAFDFGFAHIGVATGQSVTGTATPLTTISARQGRPDWPALDQLVREWRPDLLVVGLPLNMDGTESDMSTHARTFGDRLRGRYDCAVEFADERLTTYDARTPVGNATGAGADRMGKYAHAYAAKLIAETWLAARISAGS